MHRYIQMQWPEEVQKRVYIFNSFFLKKLTENTANSKAPGVCAKANHERVKKWTKVCPLKTSTLDLCQVLQSTSNEPVKAQTSRAAWLCCQVTAWAFDR